MTTLVDTAADLLGYRFEDASLLSEALTHASGADSRLKSNERMEFLGDAILGFVCCEYLYQRYPQHMEGELTKIKSAVVSRRTCAEMSQKIGLTDILQLGKGMSGRLGLPSSIEAAVFESVVAGIYLDGGLDAVRRFVLEHLVPYIESAERSAHQQNYKSLLQQHAQKQTFRDVAWGDMERAGSESPSYILVDEKGPDHAKCFEVCVELRGRRFASAWANSKKEAEQKAALHALVALELADPEELNSDSFGERVGGE